MNQRPRLSIELTPEQYKKLSNLIPWGQQRAIISTIVDELISIIEKHGQLAIGAILAKKVKFLDIVIALEEKDAARRS